MTAAAGGRGIEVALQLLPAAGVRSEPLDRETHLFLPGDFVQRSVDQREALARVGTRFGADEAVFAPGPAVKAPIRTGVAKGHCDAVGSGLDAQHAQPPRTPAQPRDVEEVARRLGRWAETVFDLVFERVERAAGVGGGDPPVEPNAQLVLRDVVRRDDRRNAKAQLGLPILLERLAICRRQGAPEQFLIELDPDQLDMPGLPGPRMSPAPRKSRSRVLISIPAPGRSRAAKVLSRFSAARLGGASGSNSR